MLFQEMPKTMADWKNLLLGLAVLAFSLLLLDLPPAFARVFSIPHGAASPINASEILSSEKGIKIDVTGRALRDVLQRIQNDSGILFQIQEEMLTYKITANFAASDWTSAVRKLLESFSRVEVWDEDGLSSVRLLKSEEYSMAPNQNTDWMIKVKQAEDKGNKTKHVIRGRKFKIFLSEKELLELIKAPTNAPLPAYFTKDLLYRKFLEQFGFESLEDVFDIHNTRTVHLEVIRQLQELKKRSESEK